MENKKQYLFRFLCIMAPFITLSPIYTSFFSILRWDLTIICIFLLSLSKRRSNYLYILYFGLFYDTMISPNLGRYILLFFILYFFFYFSHFLIKSHSAISSFIFLFIGKYLSLFIFMIFNILSENNISNIFNVSFTLSTLGTAIVGFFLFDFFIYLGGEYKFER